MRALNGVSLTIDRGEFVAIGVSAYTVGADRSTVMFETGFADWFAQYRQRLWRNSTPS